jgi:hypothetical protein
LKKEFFTRKFAGSEETTWYRDRVQLSYEDLVELEQKKYWAAYGSYLVKPNDVVEAYRQTRKHNRAGFPFLSFKQLEILRMLYALHIAGRNHMTPAVYNVMSYTSSISRFLHAVKDLRNKSYVDFTEYGKHHEFMYYLTTQAFDFLELEAPINLNISDLNVSGLNAKIPHFYAINQVFVKLIEEYRRTHYIEWLTQPAFSGSVDAAAIIWDSVYPMHAEESAIFELIGIGSKDQQLRDIWEVRDKFTKRLESKQFLSQFPTTPNVYLVHEKEPLRTPFLKLFHAGKIWAGDGQIQEWVELGR